MKIKTALITLVIALALTASAVAQESAQKGFVISLKNGSSVRGQTLSRDEASGQLRLTMTETSTGAPKSYAIIAMDDAETISVSSTESDSILVKLFGGSELKCKEFGLNGDVVTVRLGSASRIEVRWDQIESISFAP
ncbi:MAG: hypothetical protein L0229_28290 [Blastocatellia bacterium]|nr:hypothetical protein [Blastocatellia bacterium]